jgi:hypothetical protein
MLGSDLVNRRAATRHIKRSATLSILVAAALPAAAEAKVVEPVWVTGRTAVPAGQTASLTLKCPARAVALNATATSALAASSSTPAANARRWTFRFTAGASPRAGSALLRCVRLRLPHNVSGISLRVGTVFEPVFEVPPGFTQQIDVRCPTGQVPTGWGLERRSPENGLAIAGAVPTPKGWSFAVKNTGSTGAAGSVNARCLVKKQRASTGQHHTFSTRVASFSEQIENRGTTSRSCRANEYSVATGVSLPAADDIALTETTLVGERGAEWSFSQFSGATAITTSLVCLARTTGFHR